MSVKRTASGLGSGCHRPLPGSRLGQARSLQYQWRDVVWFANLDRQVNAGERVPSLPLPLPTRRRCAGPGWTHRNLTDGAGDMLPRAVRTVRVTTRQELDAALDSADQVVVEGDDQLLSYAVARASNDPQNRIAIEVQEQSGSLGRDAAEGIPFGGNSVSTPPADPAMLIGGKPLSQPSPAYVPPARSAPSPAAPASPFRPRNLMLVAVALVLLALGAGGGIYALVGAKVPQPPHTTPGPVAPANPALGAVSSIPQAVPTPEAPALVPANPPPVPPTTAAAVPLPIPPTNAAAVLQALAWPAVAIIAISALFLIARQAIAGGRNVEISWQVTEKVVGRVVITKVKSRTARERAAA